MAICLWVRYGAGRGGILHLACRGHFGCERCKNTTAFGILHIGAMSNINAVHHEDAFKFAMSLKREYKAYLDV